MRRTGAPDRIGFEVGWRAWRLVERDGWPLLASVAMPHVWRPRAPLRAVCDRTGHEPPEGSCQCGIYSARTLEHLQQLGYPDFDDLGTVVVGEVANWGRVIAATQGWRAEFAYPQRLLVPFERWQYAVPLGVRYGVPVELGNTTRNSLKGDDR